MLETFFALMFLLVVTAAFPVFVLVDTCASLHAAGLYEEGDAPRKPVRANETTPTIAAPAAPCDVLPPKYPTRKAS